MIWFPTSVRNVCLFGTLVMVALVGFLVSSFFVGDPSPPLWIAAIDWIV
ncbi:hypothetical protein PVA45_08165 (plasmid) [Entomospira entomophila]|uniref:Uncharacterized protein n=1 Tax=Entomospira entomophila TaxID=2719988 RepID=A0A968GAA7_9SPIO|nr:hypothetical protein [Entomospira entomophilus]NIZ41480.1 hypothetical protein [Entomospira entomophilus]WDI36314.1 hypothetical protein PVA45_08165 [Entomospira entomophilus]